MASSLEDHNANSLDAIAEEKTKPKENQNNEIVVRNDAKPGDRGSLGRPTWTRMSRRYLATEVLDRYKIEWEFEIGNPDYVLIKRWIPEYEQDFLWAATRQLRKDRDAVFIPDHGPKEPLDPNHPEIINAVRTKRGSDLSLEVNRVPFEKWIKWRGSKRRGKSVLDVAMKAVDTDEQTNHPGKTEFPVRLAINSNIVREELSRIVDLAVYEMRSVIISPWKPLVTYHNAITARLERLKALKVDRDARRSTESPAEVKAYPNEVAQSIVDHPDANVNHPLPGQAELQNPDIVEASEGPTNHPSKQQDQVEKDQKNGNDPELPRCEGCFLIYPPHDVPLECLDLRISHLQCLLNFMNEDLKDVFDLRQDLAEKRVREIAFDDLWHLFKPGDLIITSEPRRAYRVFHTSAGRELLTKPKAFEKRIVKSPFELNCFYVDFDLKVFGPVHESLRIAEYHGKRPINSLVANIGRRESNKTVNFSPLGFLDSPEIILAHLTERGEKRLALAPLSKGYYEGPVTINHYSVVDDNPRFPPHRSFFTEIIEITDHIDSNVVIDLSEVFNFRTTPLIGVFDWLENDPRELAEGCEHWALGNNEPLRGWRPDCTCSDIVDDFLIDNARAERYKGDQHLQSVRGIDEEMTEDHLMLLPPDIEAFVLQTRQAAMLSVDLVQKLDQEWNGKTEFKNLVLPERHEYFLKSLVGTHPSNRKSSDTVKVRENKVGKTKALIILLYGPSGLGKSDTARAIANYTQKPLFPLFFRDYPDRQEMPTHIRRCSAWGCILFIDETENSLPRRKEESLCNNADLLSSLDNFDGVIILTAKDPKAIDESILARVDISLQYHEFTQIESMKVWEIHLQKIRKEGEVEIGQEVAEDFLGYAKDEYDKGKRWSGKQIASYFRIAVSLAKYEAREGEKAVLKSAYLEIASSVFGDAEA